MRPENIPCLHYNASLPIILVPKQPIYPIFGEEYISPSLLYVYKPTKVSG